MPWSARRHHAVQCMAEPSEPFLELVQVLVPLLEHGQSYVRTCLLIVESSLLLYGEALLALYGDALAEALPPLVGALPEDGTIVFCKVRPKISSLRLTVSFSPTRE